MCVGGYCSSLEQIINHHYFSNFPSNSHALRIRFTTVDSHKVTRLVIMVKLHRTRGVNLYTAGILGLTYGPSQKYLEANEVKYFSLGGRG